MLNPETITVIDPACGSGHILVEAYDVLKAIYLERGYQLRSIPRLILEKNLYGLDIDDRAAQLAGFALLMKARADDRRLFDELPKLNVYSIQSSKNLNLPLLWRQLDLNGQSNIGVTSSLFDEPQTDLIQVIDDSNYQLIKNTLALFEQAQTLGSLIQVPAEHAQPLKDLLAQLQALTTEGDNFQTIAATTLIPFIRQAVILGMQFDAVVANPPYMGSKGMNPALKEFAKREFPDSKSDLFAMFIERGFQWCKPTGFNSMVTMQSWMFLSSYQAMREKLLQKHTLSCMVHMGNGVMGIAFGTAATIFINPHVNDYAGSFSYCDNDDLTEEGIPTQFPVQNERLKTAKPDDFKKISGSPAAYWVSDKVRDIFTNSLSLGEIADTRQGMATGDNEQFLRFWHEVNIKHLGLNTVNREEAKESGLKWFPYNKGGSFQKWYGNNDVVVDWYDDGLHIESDKANRLELGLIEKKNSKCWNKEYYFRQSISWSKVSSGKIAVRYYPTGFIFDVAGCSVFNDSQEQLFLLLAIMNSELVNKFIAVLSPTLNYEKGQIDMLPIALNLISPFKNEFYVLVENLIQITKSNLAGLETSYQSSENPLIRQKQNTLKATFEQWQTQNRAAIVEMQRLEEENNSLFIEAYGLQDELSPDVPEAQITLARADREKDSQRLISYAIGCMMGRYSLDEPGLIYAHAGNIGFDPNRYNTFPADVDGIVPITDELWFEDDAANRLNEFLLAVWDAETLEENRAWLATSLGQKGNESPQETIRRYIAGSFYKNHLQTYKKRPIYWLFSSGKQGAFQALVYLHRYNESTLSRMRAEYVVPLTGKIQSRIDMLEKDAAVASSNAEKSKLNKDIDKLKKKYVELLSFDEKLRHYADLRIQLDLDDGVKVNYGKFGDLLADVKAVTGGKDE